MGWLGLVVVWVAGSLGALRAFNLEPRIAILKEGLPGTYFGFSVAQHQIVTRDRIEFALLVGAPLDRYPDVNERFSNNEDYYGSGEGRHSYRQA